MIEDLEKKINAIQEVLSSMPRNNKKNKVKYREYLDGIIEEYAQKFFECRQEINRRQQELLKLKSIFPDNNAISEMSVGEDLNILNYYNTPYEKLGLDRLLLEISHFYKDNFQSLNEDIQAVISKFQEAGIELLAKDFCYSPYTYQYMNQFFAVITKEGVQSKVLRECFEQIYWKCPNIIFQIELNFRYLYLKKERILKEYYQKKVKDYPKDRTWISILKEYHTTFLDDQRKKDKDVGQLIDLFLSKKENIKDYSKDKIDKCYASISHEVVDIVSVFKFYDSMIEYQSYLKFKFLIDDVKKLYLERDKYKNVYKQSCKEIKKHEGKILKYTKKVLKPGKFCRSKKELLELKINEEIGQVRGLYEELELKKFYEKVVELTDDTTYYDILNLTASYYLYLRECFKQEFPDITDEEVNRQYEELKRFLVNPNITMMYNFSIKEEFDIPLIISDRYKLLGFCVSKEDIINNLDGLIEEVHKIILSYRITSSQISYEDLLFLCRCSQL